MGEAMDEESVKRGRPRDEGIDAAILSATLAMLGEYGFDGTSIEGVAQRAGVAKTTIYRRFASKAELVASALKHQAVADFPDSGCGFTDLMTLTGYLRERTMSPAGLRMIGSLLCQRDDCVEMIEAMRAKLIKTRRGQVMGCLKKAIEQGDLPAGATIDSVPEMLFGAHLARALNGRRLDHEFSYKLLSFIWLGLGGEVPR
jgi:AcrR family transcriptional regulator